MRIAVSSGSAGLGKTVISADLAVMFAARYSSRTRPAVLENNCQVGRAGV